MIVCHCHVLSDRDIRRAASEAGRSCRSVGERCGAGTSCKGCVPAIETVLRNMDSQREHRSPRRATKD